ADGSYAYVANSNATVPAGGVPQDVFTYQVSDGHGGTATSTLTLTLFSSGSTYMRGTDGPDTLTGSSSPVVLDGGGGADKLTGGIGADVIIGGTGPDTLTGGAGSDVFVFGQGFGNDVITDFTHATDKIQFASSM